MKRNFISNIFLSVFISVSFTASFAQVNWTKDEGNPTLRSVDYAWDYHLMAPFVLKEGDVYKMWYTGINTFYRIGYAESTDGKTWTRYDDSTTTISLYANSDPIMDIGENGSWDDAGLFGPSIIFDGSIYHMWYGGWDGTRSELIPKFPLNIRLGYATSPDGITWTKYPGNPVMGVGTEGSWDAQGMVGISVMYMDSLFHLWYSGINGLNTSIGYATSANGIDWERDTLNSPVLEPSMTGEWDSLCVYFNNVFYNPDLAQFEMFYAGGVTHEELHIGFAISPDGIHWTKYSNNPVMSPGPKDWDSHRFSGTSVMLMNKEYKMWYAGKGPTPPGTDVPDRVQIGYATAQELPEIEALFQFKQDSLTYHFTDESIGIITDWLWKFGDDDSSSERNPVHVYPQEGEYSVMLTINGPHGSDSSTQQIIVTRLEEKTHKMPDKFMLLNNYPNPFNPSTTIEFTLTKSDFVELRIFNILGKQVAMLVSETLNSGNYTYSWDARSFASGVYYYRIEAGNFVQTRKMIYLK